MAAPVAGAAAAVALAIHVELLARLRGVDTPTPPWWFGYARDGANLAATLMLWGAYGYAGYAPPTALLGAMLTTLAVYLLDWTLARGLRLRHVRLLLALAAAAWVGVVALTPRPVGDALGRLVAVAAPRR